MTSQTQLLIIALTWAPLFVLYSLNRFFLRNRFLKPSSTLVLPTPVERRKPPGSFLSKTGVLLVFAVNILTIFLVILVAISTPVHPRLSILQVELPLWVNIVGSVLFIINNILGLLALVYNPNYTPLYSRPPQGSILATQGPYALIRHPRYAVEALQNITFFLFTGFWLPLLGLLGWVGMYRQARAEEDYLMTLVPQAYGEYRKKTGMFLPKLKRE
jgi:protein-S-isoprenylcysteine O-methyltransferase Ste14